jgi:hypothetical protein
MLHNQVENNLIQPRTPISRISLSDVDDAFLGLVLPEVVVPTTWKLVASR